MIRLQALRLLAIGAAMLASGCSGSPITWRQKMTVEVETPAGIRTGASVVEVGNAPPPAIMSGFPGNGYLLRGEAVTVDIAPGQTLFVLLKPTSARQGGTGWYQTELIGDTLRDGAQGQPALSLPGNGRGADAWRAIARSQVKVTLAPDSWPVMVTFADMRDPKSVKLVDPVDATSTLGAGVRVQRITVAVTDEPLTTGIEKRLLWLAASEDGGLDSTMGVSANPTLAQQLGFMDFRQGVGRKTALLFSLYW